MRDPSRFLGAVLLGVALWASPAPAQSVDTGILGTVSDGSGAVIPGSDITVTSVATGVVQNTVSGRTAPSRSATSYPATTSSRRRSPGSAPSARPLPCASGRWRA